MNIVKYGQGVFGPPVIPGIGVLGNVYFVDPTNGNDDNVGSDPLAAKKSLAAAEDVCVANQNDTVFMIGGATADAVTATLAWDKSYTHLIGLSSDLPGIGQRCRLTAANTVDIDTMITFSGNGCVVKNMQLFNGTDQASAAGAAVVSGSRNHFQNCFFAGMGHATNGQQAGSYSLKVSGSENYFEDCTAGLSSILRASTNAELVLVAGSSAGPQNNTFRRCRFMSSSVTSGKFMVKLDATGSNTVYLTVFEDCIFYNFTTNWATGITDCISIVNGTGTPTYSILLKDSVLADGITGWGDVVTHIKTSSPAPANTGGVATAENA